MTAIQLNLSSVPFAPPVTLSLILMTTAYPIKVDALSFRESCHIHSPLEKEREQTGTTTHYCVWLPKHAIESINVCEEQTELSQGKNFITMKYLAVLFSGQFSLAQVPFSIPSS